MAMLWTILLLSLFLHDKEGALELGDFLTAASQQSLPRQSILSCGYGEDFGFDEPPPHRRFTLLIFSQHVPYSHLPHFLSRAPGAAGPPPGQRRRRAAQCRQLPAPHRPALPPRHFVQAEPPHSSGSSPSPLPPTSAHTRRGPSRSLS